MRAVSTDDSTRTMRFRFPGLVISLVRGSRSIERKSPLTDKYLEHPPASRGPGLLDVGIRHQERLPEEGEAPGRVKERARDSPDLVAGGIQDRDLVRADQPDIDGARFGEGQAGRLRRGLARVGPGAKAPPK